MSQQTLIYRNPLQGIPEEVQEGAKEALSAAFNEQHRRDKWVKFGFSTSEDALLRTSRQLGSVLRSIGIAASSEDEPELLLLGCPSATDFISGRSHSQKDYRDLRPTRGGAEPPFGTGCDC